MNEIEFISKLARSAGDQPVVELDLAGGVIADLRRTSAPQEDHLWRTIAAVACVVAVLAVASAARSWSSLSNPLSDLNDSPLATGLQ